MPTLNQDDGDLIVLLAGGGAGCSLDSSPKKNWVENSGGLPDYICKIAKGVMRSGKSKSQAIAIAVSRVKKWAVGGDGVNADTKAKAAAAAAEWTALKAKNKSKQIVKMSYEGSEYLMLTKVGSFNTDIVRRAWESMDRERRRVYRAAHPSGNGMETEYAPYSWIRELWTDHVIVEQESQGPDPMRYLKIPYTVSGDDVTFGEPSEVEQVWQKSEDQDVSLSANEKELLSDVLVLTPGRKSYLEIIAGIAKG